MPEMRRYIVTQTREVEVMANSSTDAALIAVVAFEYGQRGESVRLDDPNSDAMKKLDGIWGNTTRRIKETNLRIDRTG